jgi:PIN domain nuclease of toxin-antitoxin system
VIEAADAVQVSLASIWEISVAATTAIADSGFVELPVRSAHAARVAQLPLLHKDPFDRLLIAQALSEPLILLTADATLPDYGSIVQRA